MAPDDVNVVSAGGELWRHTRRIAPPPYNDGLGGSRAHTAADYSRGATSSYAQLPLPPPIPTTVETLPDW